MIDLVQAFGLVAVAELGDKTQLVCIALAARHRFQPVLIGATLAFAVLNTLAVAVGAAFGELIPEQVLLWVVAALFAIFGVLTLLGGDDDDEVDEPASDRSVLWTAFGMLFLAELGDKTQIAVAALAATRDAVPTWIGATLALVGVSALGIWVGRAALARLPERWIRRAAGAIFLLFAVLTAWSAIAA